MGHTLTVCIARLLIAADITARNKAGQTPLHYAACNDSVEACKALVKLMRNKNESIDVEDDRKRTPLFAAVELGELRDLAITDTRQL